MISKWLKDQGFKVENLRLGDRQTIRITDPAGETLELRVEDWEDSKDQLARMLGNWVLERLPDPTEIKS